METSCSKSAYEQVFREVNKNVEKVDYSEWDFEEKSRFLYTYSPGKLNTELHGKTIGIDDRNGFELYRLINESVDALPANAK